MSSLERFPVQKKRDEFEDSGSGGKSVPFDKRQAREAKINGEVIAAVPVPETREEFDPVAYFEFAKQAYIELGKKIKAMGTEPKDVPAWESADATLDQIKLLSKEHAAEPVLTKKRKIARDMEILGANFMSRQVSDELENTARGIRNERKEKELARTGLEADKERDRIRMEKEAADEKKKRATPEWQAQWTFQQRLEDTVKQLPEAQRQHDERLAELASVYGDMTPPEEVAELYRKLNDPKNRAEYLDYLRKAREGADRQIETNPMLVTAEEKDETPMGRIMPRPAPVDAGPFEQVETRVEALSADSEGTPQEWHERMRKLLRAHEMHALDADEVDRA